MRTFTTACRRMIFVRSAAESHLLAHPEVGVFLEEAVARIWLPRNRTFLSVTVDLGRPIGRSGFVQTSRIAMSEKVLFAHRVGRQKPSRVILGQGPETSLVTVLARPVGRGNYALVSAWVGSLAPEEPWDPNIRTPGRRRECERFWTSHALVWNGEVMSEPFESTWRDVLNK